MRKETRLLYLLAAIKCILPFFLQDSIYEPHRDELLYLAEGQHMAWGFMEVPPLLSVFAWLTHLFGNGMFWIKIWPSLFGAFTYILLGKIILSLNGKSFALWLGFLAFFFCGYLRVHFLFQPNFLEIFFYTLIAYGLIRYIQTNQNKWLYITGMATGFGMLSKYSIAFFIIAVLIGLMLTKERKIYRNKHFYYAGLLALLIFLPNIIWQASRHFPVAHHMAELEQTQLQYISPASFLLDQVIMFLPCFFIWMRGLYFVSFSKGGKDYRFLGWSYIIVIILLLLLHGKSYYSLGLYPPLLAFGAYHVEEITKTRLKILRYAMPIIIIGLGILILPSALPIFEPVKLSQLYKKMNVEKFGVLKWEDLQNHPLPQDFADMLGWEEAGTKMAAAYATLDSNEKKHAILFCDNYGVAGAVNYYGMRYNLPQAYSDNASFLYWLPANLHIDNLILLTDDPKEMEHKFVKEFESAKLYDSITSTYARERGDLIIILKGANEKFNQIFEEKIKKKRAN